MAKHIVLVHGAWQGSWSFELITPLLHTAGWHIHLIDLPDNGWNKKQVEYVNLDVYCNEVIETINKINEPVVLLGHSGGGLIISQVAEQIPNLIEQLVYLVGMLLPSGMTFLDFKIQCEKHYPVQDFSGIVPYLDFDKNGYSTVREYGAKQIFLHDCDAMLAEQLIQKLRLQCETGRDLCPVLSQERFGKIPKLYIEALYDRSLPIQMQRLMQQLQPNNLDIFSMATGHVPQAVQPKILVERLNQLLTR